MNDGVNLNNQNLQVHDPKLPPLISGWGKIVIVIFIGIAIWGITAYFKGPSIHSINFKGIEYRNTYSRNDTYRFTPKGQEVVGCSDQIDIHVYPNAKDVNDILSYFKADFVKYYQGSGAKILKTYYVPKTEKKEAEHFILEIVPTRYYTEFIFARLKMIDGIGCEITYSHYTRGEKSEDEVSVWLRDNGQASEQALMNWDKIPSPKELKSLWDWTK
jgi:hypothetical protein